MTEATAGPGNLLAAPAEAALHRVFARRRVQFFAVAAVTFLLVQGAAFFWPGAYAARSALLVQNTRPYSQLSAAVKESPMTVLTGGVSEEDVNSEVAILTSREVLQATVRSAGLDRVPPPWYLRALFAPLRAYERAYAGFHGVPAPGPEDRALRGLADSISAERLKDSNVLLVTLEARDPRVAETVLGELLQHYLRRHVEVHRPTDVLPFFHNQAVTLDQELVRREADLQRLQRGAGAVDVEANRESLLALEAKLREEDAALARRQGELAAQIGVYDRLLAGAARTSETGPALAPVDLTLQELKAQVLGLELEQVRLEARYRSDSPLIAENRTKLEAARAMLERERSDVLKHSPTLMEVERERARNAAERAGVEARRAALTGQLRAYQSRLLELDDANTEALRVQRLIRASEEKYLVYLARGEEARIDSALDQRRVTNVSIVQRPAASPSPVRPKKLVALIASVIGGVLSGLLFCLLLELRGQGFRRLARAFLPEPQP